MTLFTPVRGRRAVLLLTLFPLLFLTTLPGLAMEEAEARALFHQGSDAFRQANEIQTTDPVAAEALYRQAALRFERLAGEGERKSGRLYYNLGNIYTRLKDPGRAVLNYRKAKRWIHGDANLEQNLSFARSQRVDRFTPPAQRMILRVLLFWHYDLPLFHRSLLFVAIWGAFWILAALRLRYGKRIPRILLAGGGLLSLLLLSSILYEERESRAGREGVILQAEVVGRRGDGASYQPSFKEPLHAGTEFRLLESRPGWSLIELPDSRTCWLPNQSFELF